MPRAARVKSPDSIYHIMCRSISELNLFRDDDDKIYYLSIIKKYSDMNNCKVYAYCLMDNHLHLQFDPQGYDISRFMHSVNTSYVRYYNKKYARHGHVFQERFESRVLSSDSYNLAVSAYIHNNPKDLDQYCDKVHLYPFSSYGIYLGIRKDTMKLIDKGFILGLMNAKNEESALNCYIEFVERQRKNIPDGGIRKYLATVPINEYRSERKVILREHTAQKLIAYISEQLLIPTESIALSGKRSVMEFRALCSYAMRLLCGMTYKQICGYLYNITASGCSRLCQKGYEFVKQNRNYRRIINNLMCMPVN